MRFMGVILKFTNLRIFLNVHTRQKSLTAFKNSNQALHGGISCDFLKIQYLCEEASKNYQTIFNRQITSKSRNGFGIKK